MNSNQYKDLLSESSSNASNQRVGENIQTPQDKITPYQMYQPCVQNQSYYPNMMYQRANIMNSNSSTFPQAVPVCGSSVVPVYPVMPYYSYTPGYTVGYTSVIPGNPAIGNIPAPFQFFLMQPYQLGCAHNQQQQATNLQQFEQKSTQNQENVKIEQTSNNFHQTKMEGSQTTELATSSQLSILNNLNERHKQKESKELNNFYEFSKESSQSINQTELRQHNSEEDNNILKCQAFASASNRECPKIKYEDGIGQSSKIQIHTQSLQQVIPIDNQQRQMQIKMKSANSPQSYELSYDRHSKSSSEVKYLSDQPNRANGLQNQNIQQHHQTKNSKKQKKSQKEINEKIFAKNSLLKPSDRFSSSLQNKNNFLDSNFINKSDSDQYSSYSNSHLQVSINNKTNISESDNNSVSKRVSKKQEKELQKYNKKIQKISEIQDQDEIDSQKCPAVAQLTNFKNDQQKLVIRFQNENKQKQNHGVHSQMEQNTLNQVQSSQINISNQQNINEKQSNSILLQQDQSNIKHIINQSDSRVQKFTYAYNLEANNKINQASPIQKQNLHSKKQESISEKNSISNYSSSISEIKENPNNKIQASNSNSEIEVSIDFDEIESNQEQIDDRFQQHQQTKKKSSKSIKTPCTQTQNILEDYHISSPSKVIAQKQKPNYKNAQLNKCNQSISDLQSSHNEQPQKQKRARSKEIKLNSISKKNQDDSKSSEQEKQSQASFSISKQQQSQSNNHEQSQDDELLECNFSLQEEFMKKGNCVKNVIKAFQNWCRQDISDEIVKQHCPLDIQEGLSPNQVKKKLNRYIKQKTPNHQNLQRLIDHHRFKSIFLYFLQVPAQKWIETSTIKDKIQHSQFITFIVENWDNQGQLESFMKILKRKKNLVTNKELLEDKEFKDSQFY
ncbi:hypothetical protein ABPG72_006807 [Tetrahymena utriculariae]